MPLDVPSHICNKILLLNHTLEWSRPNFYSQLKAEHPAEVMLGLCLTMDTPASPTPLEENRVFEAPFFKVVAMNREGEPGV